MYQPSMTDVTRMFISPMQMYETENEQNVQMFKHDWAKEQVESMPDPVAQGVFNVSTGAIKSIASSGGGL
jgi:hypothetical protein